MYMDICCNKLFIIIIYYLPIKRFMSEHILEDNT